MPINYKEYHPKWSLISRLIRFQRAKNKCEWCGIENHSIIDKETRQPNIQKWIEYKSVIDNPFHNLSENQILKKIGLTKIVLTVAHIDQDKTNNDFKNLAALCQKCHLNHDLPNHINNRKYGRNWKKNQIGIEFPLNDS